MMKLDCVLRKIKKFRFEILCILPLLLFLLAFTFIPIIRTIILSFQSIPDPDQAIFGFTLAHYRDLFTQLDFRIAFTNTVIIAVSSLILELGLGLFLALLLSKNYRVIRFLRPLFILPLAIPTVVVGVIMVYLFSSLGWINRILMDLAVIDTPIYWMDRGARSLIMIILADCWKVTPIVMLILLAGLESIDQDLYKAARIDGAGGFYIFTRITMPLLLPSINAAIIIRGIDAFRIFALPLILMGQNLKVIGTYAYLEHAEFHNPYTSAASSVMLLAMILFALLVYIKKVGRKGISLG